MITQNTKIIYACLVVGYVLFSCSINSYEKKTYAKEIVRVKCMSCHARSSRLEGMQLDSMFNTYGKKNLETYIDEFRNKGNTSQVHPKVELMDQEQKLILYYLERYKDGVYH